MKKHIVITCCLFASICTQAQTKWSLRECIDYAIDHNIEIKQQDLQVKSAKIDLNSSKNNHLPDLSASMDQSLNFGRSISQSSNNYEAATTSNTSWSASSSTPIFTGFRITNDIKAKEFSLKAATEGLNKAKDNMQLEITSYYLDVLFKKEILQAYKDQASLTKKQVSKTEILVETGKVALSQLYDIKAEFAKDELNVTNSDNDLKNSLLNLSQTLNLQFDQNFDVISPEIGDQFLSDNTLSSLAHPNEVYQAAIGIKPHVKEAVYNIESSKKNLKVAQSGYWPTLNLTLGYSNAYQRKNGSDNTSFSDQIKNNRGEYISLNLSIPIFNRFETRNQVRKAHIDIENQELILDNVKLNLYKEIQQAYQNAVAAQAKFNSTTKAYEAAEESFKYAETRYQVGKISVFEYSEVMTKLLTSKSEQIQSKYDFVFRSKILDFYEGKQIEI